MYVSATAARTLIPVGTNYCAAANGSILYKKKKKNLSLRSTLVLQRVDKHHLKAYINAKVAFLYSAAQLRQRVKGSEPQKCNH